jgi:hypothetical protein
MKKKGELFDELDKSLSTLSVDKNKLLKRYLELKEIFGNRFKDIYINELKSDFEEIKTVCEKYLKKLENKYKNYFKIQIYESHYNPKDKFDVQVYSIKLTCEKNFYSNYIKANKSLKNLIENVTEDIECNLTIHFFGPVFTKIDDKGFDKQEVEIWENKLHQEDLDLSLSVSSSGYSPLFTDYWDDSYDKEKKKLAYERFVEIFHKLVFGV